MHIKRFGLTLLVCVSTGMATAQVGRSTAPPQVSGWSVAALYTPERAKFSGSGGDNLWLEGGAVQAERSFSRGFSGVVEVSGAHSTLVPSGYVGFDLVTLAAGPRYTLKPLQKRYHFFGQALAGGAFGFNGVFPDSSGATATSSQGFALKLGGGLNIALKGHFAVRAVEANWLYTRLTNAGNNDQRSLQLGAGMVYRF